MTFDTEPVRQPAGLKIGSGIPGGPTKLLLGQKMGGEGIPAFQSTVNAKSLGGAVGGPAQTMQGKNNQLAADYAKRFTRMQERIDHQIKTNDFVPMAVKVEKKRAPKVEVNEG